MKRFQRLLITVVATVSLAACGGEPETTESESQARSTQFQGPTANGSCSAICTEVTACCICKCNADFSWPANHACSLGCMVISAGSGGGVFDEPEDGILNFKDPTGTTTRGLPYVVSRRSPSFVAVAGHISSRGAFKAVDGLSAEVEMVHLDEYLLADAEHRAPAYHRLRSGVLGRGTDFRAQLDVRGFVAGPYLLRLRSGGQTARTVVELR